MERVEDAGHQPPAQQHPKKGCADSTAVVVTAKCPGPTPPFSESYRGRLEERPPPGRVWDGRERSRRLLENKEEGEADPRCYSRADVGTGGARERTLRWSSPSHRGKQVRVDMKKRVGEKRQISRAEEFQMNLGRGLRSEAEAGAA